MSARVRKFLRAFLWTVVALAIVAFVVRAFVGDVYYVDSSSMEPTLHGAPSGGDWVFVRYEDDPQVRRFDLGVIMRPGEREPLVKRIVGLPGETVQINDGDLFVNGARLPASVARPPPIELFDSRFDDFEHEFSLATDRWKVVGDAWHLDARGLRSALASWKLKLLDGYLATDRTPVIGKRHVGDAVLELETRVEDGWKRLMLRVTEEGDLFELELTPVSDTTARARLLRRSNQEKADELAATDLPWHAGEWRRLRWSNIDNHLAFRCDGRAIASADYDTNAPLKNMPDVGYQQLSPRISFGGGDLQAEFRAVRIARDLHWTARGRHATDTAETLSPDEVFVLGDNSGESVDSRDWGPVERAQIIGRPVWVVWPPSRWRKLTPTEEDSKP